MTWDEDTLRDICTSLAKAMLWKAGDQSNDIVDTVATSILALSKRHIEYVEQMGRDPNIVARALLYITHVHGLPIGADVQRIEIILESLMELAVPMTGMTRTSAAFLADVQVGIDDALGDVSDI